VWRGLRGLMPTRSLGDTAFRPVVIGTSQRWARDPQRDLAVIVATDGLWDVMDAATAAIDWGTAHEL
jgi:serine/threonine protein phosphatase PrpC